MDQNGRTPGGELQRDSQSSETKARADRLKRTILIVFAGMLLFAVIAIPVLRQLEGISGNRDEEETKRKQPTIIFVTPDYDYDIMKDEEYLNLNRYVMYADNDTGLNIMLDDKNIGNYGPAVAVLNEMLRCIIMGDNEGYNELFSTAYYADNEPEPPFTMQQLYDIQLTKMEVNQMQPDKGKAYTQYVFTVEYKIHKNNGTFRTDIGLDESRRQYFVLSDSTGKEVLIDQIRNVQYK